MNSKGVGHYYYCHSNCIPIHQNKSERPCGENPSDRTASPNDRKLNLRIFDVRKCNRVRDGNRGDIKQAVQEHQQKKRPKAGDKSTTQNGSATNQVTKSQEFLGGKATIGKLITEEHPDNGSHGKRVENTRLFPGTEGLGECAAWMQSETLTWTPLVRSPSSITREPDLATTLRC